MPCQTGLGTSKTAATQLSIPTDCTALQRWRTRSTTTAPALHLDRAKAVTVTACRIHVTTQFSSKPQNKQCREMQSSQTSFLSCNTPPMNTAVAKQVYYTRWLAAYGYQHKSLLNLFLLGKQNTQGDLIGEKYRLEKGNFRMPFCHFFGQKKKLKLNCKNPPKSKHYTHRGFDTTE